jgi:AraC-like DNA-binding protein
MNHGAYGRRLGSRSGSNNAPVVTVRALRNSQPAVTEIVNDTPDLGKTLPIPPEDAFLVHVMLQDCVAHDLFVDNKSVAPEPFPTGITELDDLTRDPIAEMHCPTACLSFYMPRAALAGITDDLGGLAFRAHIARAYGGAQSERRRARGGLAPWQERRAKEFLSNDLSGKLPLAQIARECGLSASHFTRAFRQSVGMAPHQWLLRLRVERAKELLLKSHDSLADVAVGCGFADQSHFTRVFTKFVGSSPGWWQRQNVSSSKQDVIGSKNLTAPSSDRSSQNAAISCNSALWTAL